MLYQPSGRSLQADLDYGFSRLPDQDVGPTAGVTEQRKMFTFPSHLTPTLVCPGFRAYSTLNFVFFVIFFRLITALNIPCVKREISH